MKIYICYIGSDDDEISDPTTQFPLLACVETSDIKSVTKAIKEAGKLSEHSELQKDDYRHEPAYQPWLDKYDFYSSWTGNEFDEVVFWVEKSST